MFRFLSVFCDDKFWIYANTQYSYVQLTLADNVVEKFKATHWCDVLTPGIISSFSTPNNFRPFCIWIAM
jgi:hypothetical protein